MIRSADCVGGPWRRCQVDDHVETSGRLGELRTSARGWHSVQLAVLGFIGLCGVLQGDAGAGLPRWLQVLSGLLVVLALVLACVATALVASAAWPVYAASSPAVGEEDHQEIARTSRRLRAGIALTYLAVTVLALAAASSWWPAHRGADAVVEVNAGGSVLCETLQDSQQGLLRLAVLGRTVSIPLEQVTRLQPLDSCAGPGT